MHVGLAEARDCLKWPSLLTACRACMACLVQKDSHAAPLLNYCRRGGAGVHQQRICCQRECLRRCAWVGLQNLCFQHRRLGHVVPRPGVQAG